MAELISLHEREKQALLEEDKPLRDAGIITRIRFCGRDRRGVEIASRALARAFLHEGFYTRFDEPREELPGPCAIVYLRIGREIITESGVEQSPGLVVVADGDLLKEGRDQILRGCEKESVLLVHSSDPPEGLKSFLRFTGTVLQLPVAATTFSESWYIGASCAGGAARLLGDIAWTALEEGLREELSVFDSPVVHKNLSRALEAFDRLAPWQDSISKVEEEVAGASGGLQ